MSSYIESIDSPGELAQSALRGELGTRLIDSVGDIRPCEGPCSTKGSGPISEVM